MKQDEYYESIRNKIINNEVTKRVKDYSKRLSDLDTYLYVGQNLSEAGKHYGEGIIKKYSEQLTKEFGKKYSTRLLYKMLKFYNYVMALKVPTLSANLSWSHYDELLSLSENNKINYYIHICIKENLTVIELKTGELKKEHIGQIEVYKNYIDKNVKKSIHDKTIGIILVRKNNKYIMEYCSDSRIRIREYLTLN